MSKSFKKRDIVWAKIKGFPWWPGMIADFIQDENGEQTEALINFIGENSHAQLPLSKITKYSENYEENCKAKRKNLPESVKIADRIAAGETSYEAESDKLNKRNKEPMNKNEPKAKPTGRLVKLQEKSQQGQGDQLSSPSRTSSVESKESVPATPSGGSVKKGKPGRKPKRLQDDPLNYDPLGLISVANASSKRTTMNSQHTLYSSGNADFEILRSRKPRTTKQHADPSEQSNQNDENVSIAGSKGGFSVDESKNQKDIISPIINNSSMQLENTKSQREQVESPANEDVKVLESHFALKATELKEKFSNLQKQMADYSSANRSGSVIASIIQECLSCLSVEALSLQELADYLGNDMGKFLYALHNLLEEFEKHLHQTSQNMHVAIKKKKENVQNLLATLKIRMITDYLEHKDYAKIFLEDFKRKIKESKRDEERMEEIPSKPILQNMEPETVNLPLVKIEQREIAKIEQPNFGKVEQREIIIVEERGIVKVEQQETGKVEQQEPVKAEQQEALKVEPLETLAVEQREIEKAESLETGKVEQRETVKPEQRETEKIEQREATKMEQLETGIVEQREPIKVEQRETVKAEQRKAEKIEQQETIKPEQQETIKPEQQETIKLEKQETIKPEQQETGIVEQQEIGKIQQPEIVKLEDQRKKSEPKDNPEQKEATNSAIHGEAPKIHEKIEEEKQVVPEAAKNFPNRKKILDHIQGLLEKKMNLKQDIAKERAAAIEKKIQLSDPGMLPKEYESRCITMMRCMKGGAVTMELLIGPEPYDWEVLRAKEAKLQAKDGSATSTQAKPTKT